MHISIAAHNTLRHIQKANRYKLFEHYDAVDNKGKNFLTGVGDAESVKFSEREYYRFLGRYRKYGRADVSTHNHSASNSFSVIDMLQPVYTPNLREIQVTTLDGRVHIMELHKEIKGKEINKYCGILNKYVENLVAIAYKNGISLEKFENLKEYNSMTKYATKVLRKILFKKFGIKFRTVLLK